MKNLLSVCSVLFAMVVGCGSAGSDSPQAVAAPVAAPTLVCNRPNEGSCSEFDEHGATVAMFGGVQPLSQQCTQEGGAWSARGTCPRDNLLGTCTNPNGVKDYHYSGDGNSSVESVRGRCTAPSQWQAP